MHCVEISTPGPPEVLKLVERPDPVAGRGEVLIRVAAAGVNRPDIMQRRGLYPPPPGASDLPGLEVAGTIESLGDGVTEWRVGDRVCALISGGGYASLCVAPAPQCLPVPTGMDSVTAAAIPEAFFTVWTDVFDRGRLRSVETALFDGGSSGIGTTAIQLASARGARVLATAGSDRKCRACEQLGAERAIDYHTEDFVDVVKQLTNGRGVDLILDIVGGDYIPRDLVSLAVEGRLVVIGFMGGDTATIDFRRVLGRRLTITGSTLRPRSVEEKGQIAAALRRQVWPLHEAAKVKPASYRPFPPGDAPAGHRLVESSEHIGKIVFTVP